MGANHRVGVARSVVRPAFKMGLALACWCIVYPSVGGGQLAPHDSLRVLHEGQRAQAAFEMFRRVRFPHVQDGGEKVCDIQVGRFCYWHREDESAVPEPREITTTREKFLRTLGRLHARSPEDPWIIGQWVRYLIEGGDDSSAIAVSRKCSSTVWWCDALKGFALHAAQRYEQAEVVFDSALAIMPEQERCRWTDISLLLPGDERTQYEKLPCGDRGGFERHFWQLADPSYAIPGNDRRTEHFTRVVLAKLSETSQNAYGLPWGDDMRELLIRYGAPISYATSWPVWPSTTGHIIGYEREPSFHFAAVTEGGDDVHWDVHAAAAPERYAPAYIDTLTKLAAQFAMFRRGDSALVVVVYDDARPHRKANTADKTVPGSMGDAVLGVLDTTMMTNQRDSIYHDVHDSTTDIHVRMARVEWRGVVAALEQYDPRTKRAGWTRVWLAPPAPLGGTPQLSTLLLFRGTDTSTAGSLDDALRTALTADVIDKRQTLGVYWEMYAGPDTAMPLASTDVSLIVTRTNGGVLRWLAHALYLFPKDAPLKVRWHDTPVLGGVSYRSVMLDLTQVPSGTYRITLAVGTDDQHRTTTTREIRVR